MCAHAETTFVLQLNAEIMEANNVIRKGDKILAMLTRNGKVIAQLPPMDIDNMEEIIINLKSVCNNVSGLVQLFVRNFTQGWHIDKLLYISDSANCSHKRIVNKDGQYCFAF